MLVSQQQLETVIYVPASGVQVYTGDVGGWKTIENTTEGNAQIRISKGVGSGPSLSIQSEYIFTFRWH